jgi:hypothetical protein
MDRTARTSESDLDQVTSEEADRSRASQTTLQDQGRTAWQRISDELLRKDGRHPELRAILCRMAEGMRQFPDPTQHLIDWKEFPAAAELSRAREIYQQIAGRLDQEADQKALAPQIANLVRALQRAAEALGVDIAVQDPTSVGAAGPGGIKEALPGLLDLAKQAYRLATGASSAV